MPRKKKNTVAKPIPVVVPLPVATSQPKLMAESAKRYAMLLVRSVRQVFTKIQKQRQERLLRVLDSVSPIKPGPVAVPPPVATSQPNPLAESVKRYAILLVRSVRQVFTKIQRQRQGRLLRVLDSVSLGDKRLVVVVQAGDERYLIGAASGSITLLSPLHNNAQPGSFATLLQQAETQRMTIN